MSRVYRVTGCPGGGKTTFLARQAEVAARKHGAHGVAIASLTKTAAAEIAGRDTPLPDHNIGTLHAHCYRALECTREEMAETGPSMREFAAAHPELAGQGANNVNNADPLDDSSEQGSGLHSVIQNHRARMTPIEHWSDDERAYHAAWETFKQSTHRLDFTDLIEACVRDPAKLAGTRALLLDEAQDFSALELRLALAWSEQTDTTVIVGDSDQCLYSWRGSDAGTLDAMHVAGERLLVQSYRCSRAVRDLALDWISQIPGRRDITWEPTDIQGAVHDAPFALRDTSDMLDQIDALDGSVMVLTTCGYMLDPLLSELRAAGVPFANAYRRKEQRWNPLRGPVAHGLAAYLRTDTGVWGEPHEHPCGTSCAPDCRRGAGPRAWGDLHAWTSLVAAKGNLARGAKAAIEEHCRTDEYGQSRAGEAVPLSTLVDLLGTAMHPALRNDTGWLTGALLAKHTRAGAYTARVYERDAGALLAEPRLTVGTVHSTKGSSCSPPDEPVLTKNRGWVAIADLDPENDRLISFDGGHHKIYRGGPRRPDGYAFTKNACPHVGDLLTFTTESSRTRITPNHQLTARWDPTGTAGRWAVYLMRRGRNWRIGITKLHQNLRSTHTVNGIVVRMNMERAESAWILGTFDSMRQTLFHEQLWAHQYYVPDLNFHVEARNDRHIDQAHQDLIWNATDSETGAMALLAARGLSPQWPLYLRPTNGQNQRQNGPRNRWLIHAANFLPGLMQIPTDPGHGRDPVWRTPTVTREHYDGDVYNLSVEPWRHYISGGAVVHNSDHVVICPELSKEAFFGEHGWHGTGQDAIRRLLYVGLTRARHTATVLEPAQHECAPLDVRTYARRAAA